MKRVYVKLMIMIVALVISNNVNAVEVSKDTELLKNSITERSNTAEALLVIEKGSDVEVIKAEGKELFVKYNSTEGWIPKSSIKHTQKVLTKKQIAQKRKLEQKILALRKKMIKTKAEAEERLIIAERNNRENRAKAIASFEKYLARQDSLSGYHEMKKAELYLRSIGELD